MDSTRVMIQWSGIGITPDMWGILAITITIGLITLLFRIRGRSDEISIPTVPLKEKPQVIVKESVSPVRHHNHNNTASHTKQSKKKHHHQQQNHQNNKNNTKNGFQHQLLAASLMGHTEKILDMDCSADGKYLVSCAEDVLPRDTRDNLDGESTKDDKENCTPSESPEGSSPGSPEGVRRNVRRRRRPKATRYTHTSPEPQAPIIREPSPPPLQRFIDLKIDENTLASMLSYYLLVPQQMASLGYPVESHMNPTHAVIYTLEFPFIPPYRPKTNNRQNVGEDSGRGSGSSSPRSADSEGESEEDLAKFGIRRKCARCSRGFYMAKNGEYLTRDRCRHHWGRLRRGYSPTVYSCCGQLAESLGCSRAPLHVWSGIDIGLNGPIEGFVRSKPPNGTAKYKVLALDCEMCYTAAGLQVARVEIVAADGRRIYGSYILPDSPVVDYNTRFSGITAVDMKNATKSLKEVQNDLMGMIDTQTILVGHGLENDLRALRILHARVVDTSISFPHVRGFPYRTSLRDLASRHLALDVQQAKHCPLEDARVSLDLMLWRLQCDFSRLSA